MQFKSSPILLFTFIAAVIMSCSAPKELEYRDYKNFKIQNMGFTSSVINLDLEYYNPNNFGLQLKNTDLDVFVNDNLLGHSSSDSLIHIPRRGNFILPLQITVDMKNILRNAISSLTGSEVTVKVTGKLKVGKANVFMSFPVNYEGKHTFSMF